MTHEAQFTDEQLTAYLDGEAGENLCAAIDAALETNDALAEQIAGLDIDKAALTTMFSTMLDDAPAMPDLQKHQKRATKAANKNIRPSFLSSFGLVATGIAAGVAMMIFLPDVFPEEPKAPGWKAVVASYQSLYSSDTLATSILSDAEAVTQLAAVSAALGADISQLPQVQGLDFKRAQVLGFNGKPLIQLAFTRPDGTPVALCIIAAKSKDAKAMSAETIQGMAAASWNRDGFAYLLIGGDQGDVTQAEAQAFEAWAGTVSDI